MLLRRNILLDTDIYKLSHPAQYPKGLSKLFSYGECRVGAMHEKQMAFGYQPIIMEHFAGDVIDPSRINEAHEEACAYFGYDNYFNKKDWDKILTKYKGKLPVTIGAVKEGSLIPTSTALFYLHSNDKLFAPYVNSLETILSHSWYTTNIATNGFYRKLALYELAIECGMTSEDALELIQYMYHDFAFRGVTCAEQAARGAMAHLIHFRGSDTTIGDRALKVYYGTKENSILKSVWATEHSVATSYGSGEGEYNYVLAQLDRTPADAIISIVADSYNTENFILNVIGREDIRQRIINRPGRFVVRLDSGKNLNTDVLKGLDTVASVFGATETGQGLKIINHNVGILQGDGIDEVTGIQLYKVIKEYDWHISNLALGSGGGLLQKTNRDQEKFAIKASYIEVNDEPKNIVKNPATDQTKRSKPGMLKTVNDHGNIHTISSATMNLDEFHKAPNLMEPILVNGEIVRKQTFDDIRDRAQKHLIEEYNAKKLVQRG
jgi:nicotinamide phosphoribosyltransferase